jgi:hypothetical protein
MKKGKAKVTALASIDDPYTRIDEHEHKHSEESGRCASAGWAEEYQHQRAISTLKWLIERK